MQEVASDNPEPEAESRAQDRAQQPLSQPDREAQPVDAEQPPRLPFAVVGVGASAGGLEAFGEFLEVMRRRSRVHVTVSPVVDKTTGEYLVVSFDLRGDSIAADPTLSSSDSDVSMAADMRRMRDELQSTVEELQSSNEELKASHEEVVSINEELQSTNEELETSKEEMQSLNEELSTVNAQLTAKMEEHQQASNDLSSLLTSTDIAVLFLDTRFRIRRFTPPTRELLDLISSDVGRPLSDMARKFEDPDLLPDAETVLARLVPAQREVMTEEGRWFLRRVTPYRTADNHIDGVVITFVDITERHRAEEALRANEEQFRRAIEDAPIPIIMQAEDGQVLQVSRTWTELTGYALPDLPTAEAWLSRAYGPGAEAVRGHMHELFQGTRMTLDVEFTIRARSGVDRHWSFSASAPGTLRDGRRFMVGMAVDVTNRQHGDEALRESQERLRLALFAAHMGTWGWDIGSDRHTRDENLSRLLGLEPVKITVPIEEFFKHIHPDDVPTVRAAFDTSARDGRPLNTEFRVLWPDGTVRWLQDQGEIFPKQDASYMAGACIDVTERRAAEAALRESEERLRLLVEGARDFAMLMLDATGHIAAWNIGAERLLGFTEAEAIGQPGAIIFTPQDRAAGAPAQELAQAADTGRATDERWHIHKDGSRFWGSGVMTVLRTPEGSVRGFVKILRDDSIPKQAEEALRHAKAEAESANEIKDEFLATLSHELRTPLSAILLWTDLLRRNQTDPAQVREAQIAIQESAQSQKELIDDLLDTSRITSGKVRLESRDVDLAALIKGAVDTILPTAKAKGIDLKSRLDPAAGIVSADPDRVRQIIWNLLTNAVKFTPTGGRVDVELQREERSIQVRVTDTGQGISAEFLPHVFTAFRQADGSSTRRHGGLGLGLAICSRLAELHGGTIRAESEGRGRGASFILDLPLPRVKVRGDGRKPSKAAKPPADSVGMLPKLRILIVEDDLLTRNGLAALLKGTGAVVTGVESAAAALESFDRSRPDVLLSDIGLPEMDGYALLSQIRQRETAAKVPPAPAIALSAFARDADRRRAMDAGFQQFLGKPVELDALIAAIKKVANPIDLPRRR